MLKRNVKISEYELPLKIEPQKKGGYVVVCTKWSDCYAQGDSIDEAILEVTAVAQSLIELYEEEGLKIPLKLQNRKGKSSLTVPVIVAS
ncbi:MAG: hypothetical protein A3D24_00800 [Candidatus Blackburnbacteria bacterium RIFCSPHIGHO2_02_FULL_39_13]|uniref:HicB-like antitoxin of toxin-antitoxin system domain-containing protein n=1 Tax=Candidatus Blackburnbacteria bacterium RIFCSPLOWO2_01_FULL_40_20 TaxID=1797519 RepID=A0A1G1VE92_9BACT|nr:MAG: hypothetical protein UT38_C0006G0042 [Microgenomates group bacterium GW2011_GWA2_39_19]OGY06805.1 MAG: hypothetical protein A2694_00610 [Candidatus Blackburnbacteria bacterium RIFCSPHIGHO2_01_FULL_40_17]OGY09013.1 MAG: hypothetical protein A3D24_00800 [Candidatus Blackburnbacteria bacterium RIFCSPHIGHO2_02_FULL_39_13]OGY13681.1 MAG: hypothetical protein A3A77_01350 [Candidatus Blackburnbacteria bacterium RIFCSPLOWO2_01_FULL_40_20]OGY15089.1 MAG: hypothetical protein A3I52_03110 [Candida